MSHARSVLLAGILLVAGFTAFFAGACDEKDVPIVVDEDEIARYIRETELGRELFRRDSLILPDPYSLPGDTTILSDTVIGMRRTVTVNVAPDTALGDYGPIGQLQEAIAFVEDEFTVVSRKLNVPGESPDTTTRFVNRLGLFTKLGDDSQPFVGWVLWGYNSLGAGQFPAPLSIALTARNTQGIIVAQFPGDADQYSVTAQSSALPHDFSFVRITDINNIPDGATFTIEASVASPSIPTRFIPLLTASHQDRIRMGTMDRVDRGNYADTVVTPNPDPRLWNVLFFQAFNDTTNAFSRAWCVPYRIPK